LREFIDAPVQNYSSGMKVRLGFAVATCIKPDVLILDEVLAVGDAGFRIKSFNKISEIIKGCAVIFVSHSMPTMMRICSKMAFMSHGRALYYGDNVNHAIELYYQAFEGENSKIEFNDGADIENIYINNKLTNCDDFIELNYLGTLTIELDILLKKEISKFFISVQITDKDLKIVGQYFSNKFYQNFTGSTNKTKIKVELNDIQFIDGDYAITYFITESIGKNYAFLATYRNYSKLRMVGLNDTIYASIFMKGKSFQNNEILSLKDE
jgi:lipopolysaccharide transport system ATP-binding protein